MIIVGKLRPGTHLVESQLSKTFDVSRGPVRDALRQLEVEGLVESRRRGVFVIGLTADDIDELYDLRALLESHAVRLCLRGGARDFTEARQQLARMEAAAAEHDPAEFAEGDLDFHSSFHRLCGNRRLDNVWQQYRPTFADMLSVTNAEDRDLGPTYRDHVELLDAIVATDSRALELLAEHIEGSRRRMHAAYSRFLDQITT
ncbi:GntR family transcriptional regulator [Saccharomonospora piscinae]|nr:GntR family transcriptional regulator [Saccharomonospora piscinae]